MIYGCMQELNVYPPSQVINIGDTVPDILAGRSEGVATLELGGDLLTGERYPWRGEWNWVRLDPSEAVAHVLLLRHPEEAP